VLVKAGSGATTMGVPDSAGVLADLVAHTRQVPFNDAEALESLLTLHTDVAALIIEPVLGNIGPILPEDNYLPGIREITRAHDVLLIFDEVITGYRLGIGGAQAAYGVKPDLTTLGKIIGGGLPVGAFGGRREIMELVAPQGPVYQAGTFSGNPLSLTAGIATLQWLHDHPALYHELDEKTRTLEESLDRADNGSFVRLGSMFKWFFRSEPPKNYREVKECNTGSFGRFWKRMLDAGIFPPPPSLRLTSFHQRTAIRISPALHGRTHNVCQNRNTGQQAGARTGINRHKKVIRSRYHVRAGDHFHQGRYHNGSTTPRDWGTGRLCTGA
jgi:glutamate-1-semialdehyde 2,1-aminomutase